MQYKIARTEIIPMLDENGIAMQMRQFEFGCEIIGDKGESLEEVENALDNAFAKQKKAIENQVPIIEIKQKQIRYLLQELKPIVGETRYKQIINKAKKIGEQHSVAT